MLIVRTIRFKGTVHQKQKILSLFVHPQVICFEDFWGTNNIGPHWLSKNIEPFFKNILFCVPQKEKSHRVWNKTRGWGNDYRIFILGEWHYAVIEANTKNTPYTCFWEILIAFKHKISFFFLHHIFPVIKKFCTHTANFKAEVFLKSFLRHLTKQ